MRLQLLSDLHLESTPGAGPRPGPPPAGVENLGSGPSFPESDSFDPSPLPGAELLVLAGDIDATWSRLDRFAGWPVPVVMVAGNHEFDGRDLTPAWPALRERCVELGIRLLELERWIFEAADGRRIRIAGTVRWADFDGLGAAQRERALRAAGYYLRVMGARRDGAEVDAAVLREEALRCRRWLEDELREPAHGRWDATIVVTHFAPSLRSADPRYGLQPGTASFCNADDDLLPLADLWLHGHVHCRHDYAIRRPGRKPTRVVCHARGLENKGETDGYEPSRAVEF
jgi:hypothetical protein